MGKLEESKQKELEQLRFFMDEVLGLFDWSDDEVDLGLDPLNFVRDRLQDERKWAKISAKKCSELQRKLDGDAGGAALAQQRSEAK